MADTQREELIAHLHAYRSDLEAAARDVPTQLRAATPSTERWSVFQILDHVAKVDGMIVRLLEALLPRAPLRASASAADVASAIARLHPVIARRTRVAAVSGSEPAPDPTPAQVATAFADARAQLLNAVAHTAGRDLTTLTYPHPIMGSLNLLEWIVFAGLHDGRHAAQIRELAGMLEHEADHLT